MGDGALTINVKQSSHACHDSVDSVSLLLSLPT